MASKWSGLLSWYFRKDAYVVITFPLFLLFSAAFVIAFMGAFVQGFALVRALYAVWGVVGLALLFVGWLPLFLPPKIYYTFLTETPSYWREPKLGVVRKILMSAVIVAVMSLIATAIFHGTGWIIGWIADRNPCAAIHAGITGSVVPTKCP